MADENPLESARKAADDLKLTGDDREDFIEARMRRAGFRKGPGDWVSADTEEYAPQDDDDQPMTRGEWRQMQHARKQAAAKKLSAPAPVKKESEQDESDGKTKKSSTNSGWWKGYGDDD